MCMNILVDDCCGCLDLKTGCYVIGYTGLTLSGLSSLYTSYLLFLSPEFAVSKQDFLNDFMRIMLYICLVQNIIHVIFSSCLVFGVHKDSRGWIKAFVVYMNVINVIQIASMLILAITLNIIPLLINLPIMMLLLYILGVVNSYHKELDNKTGTVISAATVPTVNYCAPNNATTAAVTGPVIYGAPNNGYTGPNSYEAPNDRYTSVVTGPLTYGAPYNGYTPAVACPVTYGAPNNDYTIAASAPVSNNYNPGVDTRL